MELKPSQIFYSQDSILNRFGDYTKHGNTYIGETLDHLLRGYCNVRSIPTISVVKRNSKWFTSDNRRLWVFRKAEELGFLDTIDVYEDYYLNENKFTTVNGGTSIRVRGNPGGSLWKTWSKPKPQYSDYGNRTTNYNLNRNRLTSPSRSTRTISPVIHENGNLYRCAHLATNTSGTSSVVNQNYSSTHRINSSHMTIDDDNFGKSVSINENNSPVSFGSRISNNRYSPPTRTPPAAHNAQNSPLSNQVNWNRFESRANIQPVVSPTPRLMSPRDNTEYLQTKRQMRDDDYDGCCCIIL